MVSFSIVSRRRTKKGGGPEASGKTRDTTVENRTDKFSQIQLPDILGHVTSDCELMAGDYIIPNERAY